MKYENAKLIQQCKTKSICEFLYLEESSKLKKFRKNTLNILNKKSLSKTNLKLKVDEDKKDAKSDSSPF